MISKAFRSAFACAVVSVMGFTGTVQYAAAQDTGQTITGEKYLPTIWIDPDGCEHWVMDDGAEGYMSPHVNRQGIPVCRRGDVCGVMNSDQLFATDSYRVDARGRKRLEDFFRQAQARAYVIAGHTDSRASDAYNMRLSYNRANAVASIANGVGAKVVDVRGYGERMPKASNATAAGMQQNRRVEIICIR
ncbi:OmpA family protein [Thalassobius aquimarinus]|uniref:OmpA family protein n=2 Tax=Thalassovita aquimarina TaxID=2785917 RepID=A0ABS5HUF6_9RHOB|nr:OmpA family protein [Thalassovita aquimarina]